MDLENARIKLIGVARSNPPSDAVPYLFEKKIMARLTSLPSVDAISLWAYSLWRAALPCVALVVVLGLVFGFSRPAPTSDYSQELNNLLLAGFDQMGSGW